MPHRAGQFAGLDGKSGDEGRGDVAISRGSFVVTIDMNGAPVESTGKVLCGWQKDERGQWVVKTVCWNWDQPIASLA